MPTTARLFISGLPAEARTEEELRRRFASFGQVLASEFAAPKTYGSAVFARDFGYVELAVADEAAIAKCVSAYNGAVWKGHKLRCQLARRGYKQRLQEEWDEDAAAASAQATAGSHVAPASGLPLNLGPPPPGWGSDVRSAADSLQTMQQAAGTAPKPQLPKPAAEPSRRAAAVTRAPGNDAACPLGARSTAAALAHKLPAQPAAAWPTLVPAPKPKPGPAARPAVAAVRKPEPSLGELELAAAWLGNEDSSSSSGGSSGASELEEWLEAEAGEGGGGGRLAGGRAQRPLPAPVGRTVEFISEVEQAQLLARRAAQVDLSKFGSSSEDEAPGGAAPPPARKRARQVPQLDGAGDDSSSGGGPGDDNSSSCGSEDSGSAPASSSDGTGLGSSDSGQEGSGGIASPAASSSSSDSDSESSGAGVKQEVAPPEEAEAGPHAAEPAEPAAIADAGAARQPWRPPGIEAGWAARLLPAGRGFMRTEPLEQLEASWRVHREAWAQDYRSKARQAAKHAGHGAKRGRRK